jgi:hypothetical protein
MRKNGVDTLIGPGIAIEIFDVIIFLENSIVKRNLNVSKTRTVVYPIPQDQIVHHVENDETNNHNADRLPQAG